MSNSLPSGNTLSSKPHDGSNFRGKPVGMRSVLQEWLRFIRAEGHIIREHPDLIFQQAANQAADTSPAIQAELRWTSEKTKKPWIKRINHAYGQSVMTLAAHDRGVECCAFLSADVLISCGRNLQKQVELKLWDFRTGVVGDVFVVGDENSKLAVLSPEGSQLGVIEAGRIKIINVRSGALEFSLTTAEHADCLAFQRSGQLLAWANSGEIHLFDQKSGKEVSLINTGLTNISSLGFSPGGENLVAGTNDGSVAVFNLISRNRTAALPEAHTAKVTSVSFSSDGELFMSSSDDHTVRVCRTDSAETIALLEGHRSKARNVGCVNWSGFSPDGRWIATAAEDTTVRLWSTDSWTEVVKETEHTSGVLCGAFSPDQKYIVSGSYDRTIRVWEIPPPVEKARAVSWYGGASYCTFSADGSLIVASNLYGETHVVDASTGKDIKVFEGSPSIWVRTIAVSYDGRLVALKNEDKKLVIYDTKLNQTISVLPDRSDNYFFFSPDAKTLVTVSSIFAGGDFYVWDVDTSSERTKFPTGHGTNVNAATYSPDGSRFLSSGVSLKVWDASTFRPCLNRNIDTKDIRYAADGRLVAMSIWNQVAVFDPVSFIEKFRVSADGLMCFALSPDSRYLATADKNKQLHLWDAQTGAPIDTFHGHTDHILAVNFTSDGTQLISVSTDSTIRFWSLAAKNTREAPPLARLGTIGACSFAPDNGKIAWLPRDAEVYLCDTKRGAKLGTLKTRINACTHYEFVPDGNAIVCGIQNGRVLFHDAESREIIADMQLSAERISCVAISPDGNVIVIGGLGRGGDTGGKVFFERISEVQPLRTPGSLSNAAWSRDGRHLLTQGVDDNQLRDPLNDFSQRFRLPPEVSFFSPAWPKPSPFTANGKWIVGISENSQLGNWVYVFDLETGVEHTRWPFVGRLTCWASSPDAQYFLAGTRAGDLVLWQLPNGGEVWRMRAHQNSVLWCDFFSDSSTIITGSPDQSIKLWSITGDQLAYYVTASPLSAMHSAATTAMFAGGTKKGDLYLLKAFGLDLPAPLLTLTYQMNYTYERFRLTGEWNQRPGARCPGCARWFTPPVDLVKKANGYDDEMHALAECDHCQQPMRFNEFVIDHRARN